MSQTHFDPIHSQSTQLSLANLTIDAQKPRQSVFLYVFVFVKFLTSFWQAFPKASQNLDSFILSFSTSQVW